MCEEFYYRSHSFNLSSKIRPFAVNKNSCTLMLLYNLGEPEWITVPCDEKLIADVFCVTHLAVTQRHHSDMKLTNLVCSQGAVKIRNTCYVYQWSPNRIHSINGTMKNLFFYIDPEMPAKFISWFDLNKYKEYFPSINILSYFLPHVRNYKMYGKKVRSASQENTKTAYLYTEKIIKITVEGNVRRCQNRRYLQPDQSDYCEGCKTVRNNVEGSTIYINGWYLNSKYLTDGTKINVLICIDENLISLLDLNKYNEYILLTFILSHIGRYNIDNPKRYSHFYITKGYAYEKNEHGVYIFKEKMINISVGGNVFRCRNNVYMSYLHYPFEKDKCTVYETIKDNLQGTNMSCPILYYKTAKETCQFYLIIQKNNYNIEQSKSMKTAENFTCNNRRTISTNLLNDLVPDCGPNAEDENELTNSMAYGDVCSVKGKLSCFKGHSKCFDISNICHYELDIFGHLAPCRNGGHLHTCEEFDCNHMFKCPQYYCISWGYVCDGKWDCPGGTDELSDYNCGVHRLCQNMFKCQYSQRCIHLGDVCDGVPHCPYEDDEEYCSLWDITYSMCPAACQCLLFAIECFQFDTLVLLGFKAFPYFAVFINNSSVTNSFSSLFRDIGVLCLTECTVEEICSLLTELTNLLFLDVSSN